MSQPTTVRLYAEPLEGRDVPAAQSIFAVGGGPGGPPRVEVFNTVTGQKVGDFLAFENTFTGGVTTAIGDVTGDGQGDLIIGASVGGGPRVKVVDGRLFGFGTNPGSAPLNGTDQLPDTFVVADFFAFESSQRGGSNVAAGNFFGGLNADLAIGAGPGGGPRVRVLDGTAIANQRRAFTSDTQGDTVANFFAFEATFRNGVVLAAAPGPLGGVTFSDLVVAPGIGGGPRVRVLNGSQIAAKQLGYSSFDLNDVRADFLYGDPSSRAGLYVATADFNRDNTADVVVGTGPGVTGAYTIFNGSSVLTQGGNFTGNLAGDVIYSSSFGGYSAGVTVGAAVLPNTVNSGYLLLGIGDQTNRGQVDVSQFLPGSGFLTKQTVYGITFDDNFFGGVFVSV